MKERLKSLIKNAYAPCSKFRVAAVVVMDDGKIFEGVNVELPSYIGGICAERNAIYNAFTNGYRKGDFMELHIMVDADKIGYPCFVCRQTISELCGDLEKIMLYTSDGKVEMTSYGEIITHAFTEDNLK